MTAVLFTRECVCCGWAPYDSTPLEQVCNRCRGGIRADLADLPALYGRLGDAMLPGSGTNSPVSGSRTPPLPARLEPMNLRGAASPGSTPVTLVPLYRTRSEQVPNPDLVERAKKLTVTVFHKEPVVDDNGEQVMVPDGDQDGAVPIVGYLRAWEADWRDLFGETAPRFEGDTEQTIKSLVRYLTRHLDKACDEHPAINAFRQELRDLHRSCEQAAAELVHLVKLGPCPGSGEDSCGQLLRADPHATGVSCRSCGAYWDRAHLLFLGQVLDQGESA